MRRLKFGANPPQFPPVEANRAMARAYEEAGIDFLIYWDQQSLTIPPSIWTPDLVPAAEHLDVNAWFDPWTQVIDAALATERVGLSLVACDSGRRPPSVLAQMALSADHYAKGRFRLALGAGEIKQFRPYGIARDKPFGRLEEQLQIVRKLCESTTPVDFDGRFWTLRNALMAVPPFRAGGPELLVAGGPGKALRFSAQLADGWSSYFPEVLSAEHYAEQVELFRSLATDAGRDPEAMCRMLTFGVVLADAEEEVDELVRHPVLRWDAAALVGDTRVWRQHGLENPFGTDYSYPRDLIPMDWSREDALGIAERVEPSDVRKFRACGTPESVADQIQPYIDAGANEIVALDYAPMLTADDPERCVRRMAELHTILRERNRVAAPAASA